MITSISYKSQGEQSYRNVHALLYIREQTKQKPVTLFFTRTCGKNEGLEIMDETYIGSRG